MKADKNLYKSLAPLLDNSGIKQFSIEDAEAQNNLEELLPLFKKSTVNVSLKTALFSISIKTQNKNLKVHAEADTTITRDSALELQFLMMKL